MQAGSKCQGEKIIIKNIARILLHLVKFPLQRILCALFAQPRSFFYQICAYLECYPTQVVILKKVIFDMYKSSKHIKWKLRRVWSVHALDGHRQIFSPRSIICARPITSLAEDKNQPRHISLICTDRTLRKDQLICSILAVRSNVLVRMYARTYYALKHPDEKDKESYTHSWTLIERMGSKYNTAG